jgi:hypothetical protein
MLHKSQDDSILVETQRANQTPLIEFDFGGCNDMQPLSQFVMNE